MSGFFPSTAIFNSPASGGTVSALGSRLTYASPAGGAVAANPPGFSPGTSQTSTGRLIVTLPAGNATWASFPAGADGQLMEVKNADAANTLILPATVFLGFGDLNLAPGNKVLCYYDSTDGAWERTSP